MAIVKNLMVRVGADLSGFVSGMSKAAGASSKFSSKTAKAMRESAGSMSQLKKAMSESGKNAGIVKLTDQIRALEAEQKAMKAAGFSWGYEGFETNQAVLNGLKSDLQAYIDTLDTEPDGPKRWVSQLRQVQSVQGELRQAGETGGIGSGAASEIDGMRQRLDEFINGLRASVRESEPLGAQLRAAKDALKQMETAGLGAGDAEWDSMYLTVQRLTQEVNDYKAALVTVPQSIWSRMSGGARSAFSAVATGAGRIRGYLSAAGRGVKSLTDKLRSIGGAALNGVKKAISWIGHIGPSARSSSAGVGELMRRLKRIGIVALGLRFMRGIFGELQGIIRSYVIQNAALQAQIESLKVSMGHALAPAINLVTNALAAMMPYIIGVSNAIGTLLTNLFGKGWTTVASGASAAAAATGAAAGAQEEYNRTLAGFDEITKLDKSNTGGGGGGGGSSGSTTTPIEGKLPSWLTDLASQIKDAVSQGDFKGVGVILADKLGEAVDHARAAINDTAFRAKVNAFVDGAADIINGFFGEMTYSPETGASIAERTGALIGDAVGLALSTIDRFLTSVDFSTIGTAIGQGINGAISSMSSAGANLGTVIGDIVRSGVNAAKGIIDTVDFGAVGSSIASNLNSALHGVDWGMAGETVSDGILGVLDTMRTAVREFDWAGLGDSIKEFCDNIDWNGIVASIDAGFGELAGGLVTALYAAIGESLTEGVVSDSVVGEMEAAGGNVFQGILNGIANAIKGIGTWIKDNLFTPFIEGFKSTFNIHSPSTNTEIVGLGKNTMLGILNGFIAPLVSIGTWIYDNIFTPIKNAFDSVFDGVDFLGGIFDSVGDDSIVISVVAKFVSWVDELRDKVVDFKARLTTWREALSNKIVDFKARLTSWWDSLQNKIISFKAKLTSWIDSLPSKILSFVAKLSSWKDALPEKVLSYTAKLTTWKDALGSKIVTFSANIVKGWKGTLASWLGISTITSWLNLKVPTITIKWSSVTAFGQTFRYPSGFNITWNAKGGILDGASIFGGKGNTLFGGGEAGREALLPLDRNTWWMDKIADKVVQKITRRESNGETTLVVQLVLDGKVITEKVIRNIKQQTRTTGKNPLSALI